MKSRSVEFLHEQLKTNVKLLLEFYCDHFNEKNLLPPNETWNSRFNSICRLCDPLLTSSTIQELLNWVIKFVVVSVFMMTAIMLPFVVLWIEQTVYCKLVLYIRKLCTIIEVWTAKYSPVLMLHIAFSALRWTSRKLHKYQEHTSDRGRISGKSTFGDDRCTNICAWGCLCFVDLSVPVGFLLLINAYLFYYQVRPLDKCATMKQLVQL